MEGWHYTDKGTAKPTHKLTSKRYNIGFKQTLSANGFVNLSQNHLIKFNKLHHCVWFMIWNPERPVLYNQFQLRICSVHTPWICKLKASTAEAPRSEKSDIQISSLDYYVLQGRLMRTKITENRWWLLRWLHKLYTIHVETEMAEEETHSISIDK